MNPQRQSGDDPVRVSLPRSTWVAFAACAAVPAVALLLQLAVVEDQRRTIREQRELTSRLVVQAAETRADAAPLLRTAPPLVKELSSSLPAARATGRRLDDLARATTPLVRDLQAADLGTAVRDLGTLAGDLDGAGLPDAVRATRTVSGELLSQDRLRRLLVRSVAVLGDVRARQLVPKTARAAALAPELLRAQRLSLSTLRASLATQRSTAELARQILEVARETNAHAASLDRKLGGEVPAGSR